MGLMVFFSFAFVVYRLGVGLVESIIFALIIGAAAAAFILRECSLMKRLTADEKRHFQEVGVLSERIENFYASPSINIVLCNAGSLIVDRASVGFLDLVEAAADQKVGGRRLESLLGVEATSLERVVDDIRSGVAKTPPVLECRPAVGTSLRVRVTGHYLEEDHLVEIAIQPIREPVAPAGEVDQAMADLERFRHGMARREQRILELKGEVNDLLKERGQSVRYKVDHRTESPFAETVLPNQVRKEGRVNG